MYVQYIPVIYIYVLINAYIGARRGGFNVGNFPPGFLKTKYEPVILGNILN